MEVELKLLVESEARALVERFPAFRDVVPRRRRALTTYYDTPDLALYRAGASLRVREVDDGFVQTVKLDAAGAELGGRGEWEWSVGSKVPEIERLGDLPPQAGSVYAVAADVKPIFVTDIERTTWDIEHKGRVAIEAVFDQGVIRAGSVSLVVSEVELELKRGTAVDLYRVAIALCERVPLRFGSQSKSERGYGLISESLPERSLGDAPAIERDVTIRQAVPRLVHAALREFCAEIPAASAGDVDGVHRMRAAIRKLRSVLLLFAPCLQRKVARRFNDALRDLGAILGRGRDWDVFLTETLPAAEVSGRGAGAAPLRAPAERQRAQAHAAIAEAMRDHALTGLILGLGAWTSDEGWLRRAKPKTPLADLAPDLLDTLHKRIVRLSAHPAGDDAQHLHKLRRALKKLRYSSEYLAALYDPEAVDTHLHAVKSVLSGLGDINDAAVTELRLAEIATAGRPELAPAAAALSGYVAHRGRKALSRTGKKLAALHAIEPFWR